MKNCNEETIAESQEQGFTLLEYCAGAAVIAGVVWVAMDQLGGSLAGLIENLAAWAASRGSDIS